MKRIEKGPRAPRLSLAAPALLALIAGCSSDNGGPNNGGNEQETIAKTSAESGDAQFGNPNTALPDPLRVIIRRGTTPVSGKEVTWQVTAGNGTVAPTVSTTATDGIATTVVTLGNTDMTITASASGVTGSPVSFSASVIGLNGAVTVSNNLFSPQDITIKVGGTVTFTWATGASGHNVVPDGGKTVPASPDQPATKNAPFSFQATFSAAGDYFYHCSAHGGPQSGMYGKITVVP